MGLGESLILQMMKQQQKAAPDRVLKEREAILNELGNVEMLTKNFADLQNKSGPLEKSIRGLTGQGRTSGLIDTLTGVIGSNPAVEQYTSQIPMVKAALQSIAMPNARGGAVGMQAFDPAIPHKNANWQEFGGAMMNLVQDAFNRRSSNQGEMYSGIDPAQWTKTLLGRYMPADELKKFLEQNNKIQGPMSPVTFGAPLNYNGMTGETGTGSE